jgi:putative FmdB family regulatory protein
MPLYEYTCQECQNRFEVLQRIGEGAEGVQCPECDSDDIEKEFSTFASASDSGGMSFGGGSGACGGGGGGFT